MMAKSEKEMDMPYSSEDGHARESIRVLLTGGNGWLAQRLLFHCEPLKAFLQGAGSSRSSGEARQGKVYVATSSEVPPHTTSSDKGRTESAHIEFLPPFAAKPYFESSEFLCKVREINPHVVIHAAAVSAPKDCEAMDPEELRKCNSPDMFAAFLQESLSLGCQIIFCSTDMVHAGEPGAGVSPLSERSAVPKPVNAYGRSKLAFEKTLEGLFTENDVRIYNVGGPEGLSRVGLAKKVEEAFGRRLEKDGSKREAHQFDCDTCLTRDLDLGYPVPLDLTMTSAKFEEDYKFRFRSVEELLDESEL
eukprot:g8066.t1